MLKLNFLKNHKIVLAIMAIFFIALSVLIGFSGNILMFRFLRGVICYTVLIYLLLVHGRQIQKWIIGFLFFYGASSITTVWYENSQMASLAMMLNSISFLILLLYIAPKFHLKKIKKGFTFLFLIAMVINGYLFFQLLDLIKGMILSQTQYFFMCLCIICALLLAFFALADNHFSNTRASMVFILLIFLIIFGEIFRSIAYYKLGDTLLYLYLGRIFLILSLSALVHFSFLEKKKAEKLGTSILK